MACILQNTYLGLLKKLKEPVAIFMINGIKLMGVILDFDDEVVLLHHTVTLLIYKSKIGKLK